MSALRFTKDHEWVSLDDGTAICGISDYAQKALGDVVFVELPEIGKKVKRGDTAAVVESVKAASEVYAPIDGEVIAINDHLGTEPARVNTSATNDGWFFKLKPFHPEQAEELMDEAAYGEFVKGLG